MVHFHEKNPASMALPLCTAPRPLEMLGKEIFQDLEPHSHCRREKTEAYAVPGAPRGAS